MLYLMHMYIYEIHVYMHTCTYTYMYIICLNTKIRHHIFERAELDMVRG